MINLYVFIDPLKSKLTELNIYAVRKLNLIQQNRLLELIATPPLSNLIENLLRNLLTINN